MALAEIRVRVPQCLRDRQRSTSRDRRWIGYYNADRPHSALAGRTPDEAYAIETEQEKLAA
jgi:transposase InsO family protein